MENTNQYKNTLPPNFNPTLYRFLNKDLVCLTDEELESHYCSVGLKEGRQYSEKLPSCVSDVIIDKRLLQDSKWLDFYNEKDIFININKTDLNCNTLKRCMVFNFKGKNYTILRTFLISKSNKSDIQLFHYTSEYTFIASVTDYYVEAIYDNTTKILYMNSANNAHKNLYVSNLDIFTRLIQTHKDIFQHHLENTAPVKLCTFLGIKQIMHHYINDMSGIWMLLAELKIHALFSQFEYYGKHEDLFKEKLANTIIFRNLDIEEIFIKTCKENLFFIKRIDSFVPTTLNLSVINNAKTNSKICMPKYNKCVLFTVRTSHRKLVNQAGFIVTCIKQIEKRYPDSLYLIDGMSKLYSTEFTEESPLIKEEKKVFTLIQSRLPNIQIQSLIFSNIMEFINYAQYVDYYVAHIGTCQHKLGYFSKAKGVVHGGGDSRFGETDKDGWYWRSHFGRVCTKIDNCCFVYDKKHDYTSNYTAKLDICQQWAQTIII